MARKALSRIFLSTTLACMTGLVFADVLLIEQVRQGGRMELPVNGMSMAEVEAAFGAPDEKRGAIGDPPISRWVYPRWSVYFEYDRALYTVLHEGEIIEGVSEPVIDYEDGAEPADGVDADSG